MTAEPTGETPIKPAVAAVVETTAPTERRITPAKLVADNHSLEATTYLTRWNKIVREGDFDVVLACDDARMILSDDESEVDLRTIAAACLPDFDDFVFSRGSRARTNIIVVHKPCGGMGVKAQQVKDGVAEPETPSAKYVKSRIHHINPSVHGILTGQRVALGSGRPTLVVMEEQATGKLEILAEFLPQPDLSLVVNTKLDYTRIDSSDYDDPNISPEPLDLKATPEAFQRFLANYQKTVEGIREKNSDLAEHQKINNPDAVLITDQIAGNRRFPQTFGELNSVFTITAPPTKDGVLSEVGIQATFDQAHYAFSHALESNGNLTKPFNRLAKGGTLILEASSLKNLAFLANEAFAREDVREWKNSDSANQIILLESHSGRVEHAWTYDQFVKHFIPQ